MAEDLPETARPIGNMRAEPKMAVLDDEIIDEEVATLAVTGDRPTVVPGVNSIIATAAKMSTDADKVLKILKGVVARIPSIFKVQTWDSAFVQAIIDHLRLKLADDGWVRTICTTVLPMMHSSWDRNRAYRVVATLAVFEAFLAAASLPDDEPLPGEDMSEAEGLKAVLDAMRECGSITEVRKVLADFDSLEQDDE